MWTIISIIIILLLIAYGIYSTIGMLRGLKKVEYYEELFRKFKSKISNAYSEMQQLDTLGAFEADDEIGISFKEIKEIVDDLNEYLIEEEETEGENI